MVKKWVFRDCTADSPPEGWGEALCISPALLAILWRRGLATAAGMDEFLRPSLSRLTAPPLWPQIPQAARMLKNALLKGAKPVVWGDYDVDGVTATVLCLDVLDAHGIHARHHLPDRSTEGYGLNIPAIEALAEEGCDLLLTVDCGISDVAAVARARELGMTVVVSDHHLPPEELPPADAICDPRMGPPGEVPCTDLAGVGVAFFLMAALNAELAPHTKTRYEMDRALDLVALGTLADLMPLRGENRILVHAGLKHIARALRPGIAALKEICEQDIAAAMTSGQVSFRMAPRINAAGRMEQAETGLRLLRERDYTEALHLARHLDELNQARRTEEDRIFIEAREQAEALLAHGPQPALVLYGENWHPGVIGIVASRIVEAFYRPTVILCSDHGSLKGSARSVHEFDLHAGLTQTADCLMGFGGHRSAAGLRLAPERLEEFRAAFTQAVEKELGSATLTPQLTLECEIDLAQASSLRFIKELDLLQPFGMGNAEPVFASTPLTVIKHTFIGRDGKHILLHVRDRKSGISMRAKGWRLAKDYPPPCLQGRDIRLAFTLSLDTFNGVESADMEIKDIQIIDD
ncbi:MAG: single-stranded-DNA-specific exonuclease RecJ [Desulfovibrio sp.]|nr:single-stranded-DNA-specific exonuclease RecJ [Desulfovibrio sp.]